MGLCKSKGREGQLLKVSFATDIPPQPNYLHFNYSGPVLTVTGLPFANKFSFKPNQKFLTPPIPEPVPQPLQMPLLLYMNMHISINIHLHL